MIKHPIIMTDLDGTLLDHYSYSFEPAKGVLDYLESQHVPLIANTSKTFAELVHIRKEINNHFPFVVENGAAIYIPQKLFPACPQGCTDEGPYWRFQLSRSREHWLELIHQVKSRYQSLYTPFHSLSDEQIAKLTGLSIEEAHRAAQRQFGEPLLWHGDREDKEDFIQEVKMLGGHVLQGGRFLHVGDKVNKGVAMEWLKALYQTANPSQNIQTIALGDSHNDIDMLEAADHAVIVASPAHPAPTVNRSHNLIKTQEYGPKGWAQALIQLLDIPA